MDIRLEGFKEGVFTERVCEIVSSKILEMKDQIKKEIVNQVATELKEELDVNPALNARINEILDKADKTIQIRINKQYNDTTNH